MDSAAPQEAVRKTEEDLPELVIARELQVLQPGLLETELSS